MIKKEKIMDRLITITGNGRFSTRPDKICISMSIKGENKNYNEAMEIADKKVLDLKAKLAENGFDEKKIYTNDLNVRAVNKYVESKLSGNRYVFDKYCATHSIKIDFEYDTKKLAKCIDTIVDSVAEPNFSISFEVENEKPLKEKAMGNAVQDAKRKAEVLAKSAGVKLGSLVSIDHSFSQINIYRPRTLNMEYDGVRAKSSASASLEGMNVEDLFVDANVTVQWEIKD